MFSGDHGEMNYTDGVGDLMIDVHNARRQMTELARQLKVQERSGSRREGGGSPLGPLSLSWDPQLSLPGPVWEAVLQARPGLGALLCPWLPGSERGGGRASLRIQGVPQ